MVQRFLTGFRLAVLLGDMGASILARAPEADSLSLCGQCLSPSVISKSGLGTDHAVAEAKITRQDAIDWCTNWRPDGIPEPCVKEQMASAGNRIYRAAANCADGRLTAIDGKPYVFAGIWNSDVGRGRSRWKDPATGTVVGQDEASGGLALAQQWEVLCPGLRAGPSRAAGSVAGSLRPVSQGERNGNQAPSACAGRQNCADVASFAAVITDFRTSVNGRYRVLITTVRFQNKLNRPLILGYVQNSGVATDDQGNRYEVYPASVRGIGVIASTADPKFILQPGEASDARFEFVFQPGRQILGTVYDMDMTIREINPLPGNQFRLGLEHAMHYQRLGGASAPAVAAAGQAPSLPPPVPSAPPVAAPVPLPEPTDLCGGKPRCYSAGPFLAEVTQINGSQAAPGAHHVVRIDVRFRNMTNQPLSLGYKARTSQATDNYGNPYYWGRAGAPDHSSSGIGMVAGNSADPSFTLNPGEARNATFQIIRFNPGRTALGSTFAWNAAVEQLEILPGNQVRSAREYSLSFQDLTVGLPSPLGRSSDSVGDTARKLKDIFKPRQK